MFRRRVCLPMLHTALGRLTLEIGEWHNVCSACRRVRSDVMTTLCEGDSCTMITEPGSRVPKRGFATMDKKKRREIARLGGCAAHKGGGAHKFSSEEARKAGRKGGTSVSNNREYMSLIGRRGAQARHSPGKRRKGNDEAP